MLKPLTCRIIPESLIDQGPEFWANHHRLGIWKIIGEAARGRGLYPRSQIRDRGHPAGGDTGNLHFQWPLQNAGGENLARGRVGDKPLTKLKVYLIARIGEAE